MLQVREERVQRTMDETGMDRMQAINFERGRNVVQEAFRRGSGHPSWAIKPSWALEG